MKLNLKSDQCWEVITPVIDELALLGVVTADWFLAKMEPFTKNVPPESESMLGNDLSKRINQLKNTNTTLIKNSVRPYSSYSGKNNIYPFKQSKPSTSATNTPKSLHSSQKGSA